MNKIQEIIKNIPYQVTLIIILVCMLLSVQIAFYGRIHQPHTMSFSAEVNDHNLTIEKINNIFVDETDWNVKYITSEEHDVDELAIMNSPNEGSWAGIWINNEGSLEIFGDYRLSSHTEGPPIHPRSLRLTSDEKNRIQSQTKAFVNDIFVILNLDVPENNIDVRYSAFGTFFESVSLQLFFLTYVIIFLILSTTITFFIKKLNFHDLILSISWGLGIGFSSIHIFLLILILYFFIQNSFFHNWLFLVTSIVINITIIISGIKWVFFSDMKKLPKKVATN